MVPIYNQNTNSSTSMQSQMQSTEYLRISSTIALCVRLSNFSNFFATSRFKSLKYKEYVMYFQSVEYPLVVLIHTVGSISFKKSMTFNGGPVVRKVDSVIYW